jgi:hypothetical protein
MCLVQILYQRKRDLYRVPPEILFASRKINTSGNKAKDTRTSGNQGTRSMEAVITMKVELWVMGIAEG